MANTDNQSTVENSGSSAPSEKRRTSKTAKLTPEQALEILASALLQCANAGIPVRLGNLFDTGTVSAGIVLEGVKHEDRKLLLANTGKER